MWNVNEEHGVIEEIEFLARSPNRVRILEAIHDADTIEKRALQTQFDMARTTLGRNLDALADHGWIRSEYQTYAITPAGRAVVESFLDLTETMGTAVQFKEFFEWMPAAEFDLDLQHLADADLLIPEPGDPYAMINRHVSKLKTMEECRALLPFTGLHAAEAGTRQIITAGARAEVVVEPDVADPYQSNPHYAESIDEAVATGRFEVFVYEDTIPYGLNVIDETVQLAVAEGDVPRALLESDSTEVREWAMRTFEEYKRQATPVF